MHRLAPCSSSAIKGRTNSIANHRQISLKILKYPSQIINERNSIIALLVDREIPVKLALGVYDNRN